MKKTLITLTLLATLANAEFTKSGNIVTDSTTGLQWQDDATATSTRPTWQGAIDHCENLTDFLGYSDWRLPNLNELKSIVDRSKSNPAIVNGFVNTSSSYYWSSTTNADDSDYAWNVSIYNGNVDDYNKDSSNYVRCVRAGE